MTKDRVVRLVACVVAGLALLLSPAVSEFSPVAYGATTVTSVRSGGWSVPATWNAGRIPAAGDIVVIATGTAVTYDRFSDVEIGKVVVRGTLTFSRSASTRLDSGNVLVESGGYLDMGTPTSPIEPSAVAELRLVTRPTATCVGGEVFSENDVGVWVLAGGRWEVHGTPVRHSWAKLIADAPAGGTVLKVRENVSDWAVGSLVLVTPSSMGLAAADYEEIAITRAYYAGDHSEITLSKALRVFHQGSAASAAEVALLSHNVVVTSKYPDYPMQGHTMFTGTAKGSIAYAEFRDLGMFGCLSRYPIHFHMMQDASRGMSVRSASVWRSDNHFMNIHGSNGVFVEDVVGYDAPGIGFFIGEAPATMMSVDNVFIHNLAAKVVWRTGALDGQQRSTGFWIENRNSTIIDNVASGSGGTSKTDSGFHLAEHGKFVAGFSPMVMVRNEAHSNKSSGFFVRANVHETFVVLDFRGWRNPLAGIWWGSYSTKFQIHRAALYENGSYNLLSSAIRAHLQDSSLYGTTLFPTPTGLFIEGYAVDNNPATPVKLLRNTFSGHTVDFSQDHTECTQGAEQFNPLSRICPGNYIVAAGNRFLSPRPVDFGWQRNANSWMDVRTWSGAATPPAPINFKLTRKDQPRPDADAYYHGGFDAWLNPTTVVAQSGLVGSTAEGARARPAPSPTPAPAGAAPLPTISLVSPMEGALLSGSMELEVTVSAPVAVTKVEFFADGQRLATVTASPYRYTWATGTWVRKRAYVYACVTDSAGGFACSTVARLYRTAP